LIFHELVSGANDKAVKNPAVAYMIDASHNTKDPVEDLMQSLENIFIAYAKALLVDFRALEKAQLENDVTFAEQILQRAFQSDVRPLLAEARLQSGGCLDPLNFFKSHSVRDTLIKQRGKQAVATGL
jgi:L-rhamnose isomerase/sugar isomerase